MISSKKCEYRFYQQQQKQQQPFQCGAAAAAICIQGRCRLINFIIQQLGLEFGILDFCELVNFKIQELHL